MAINYIKIERDVVTATHARLLLDYVSALRSAYDKGVFIKGIMDNNTDGTDFSKIEELFGVPVGSGSSAYTLLGSSLTAGAKTFTERVG